MDEPHEFREDVDDYSMCVCGVPADVHADVEIGRRDVDGRS